MSAVQLPARPSKPGKAGQAAVAEPPMLPMLEDMIVSKYRAHGSALLGSWLTGTGVLRYKHIMRSQLRRLSHSTFHGRCAKGKQRQNRQGFDFCASAVFANGWPWGQIVLAKWQRLPGEVRGSSGLCFNKAGQPWSLATVQSVMREAFGQHLESIWN